MYRQKIKQNLYLWAWSASWFLGAIDKAMKEMDENTKSQHAIMVESLVNYLIKDGYINIKANITGFDPPDNIYCGSDTFLIPDVTAVKSGWGQIFEVETVDSINKADTAGQWSCFSVHARKFNKSFNVVVPETIKSDVKELLQSLDISAGVWTLN